MSDTELNTEKEEVTEKAASSTPSVQKKQGGRGGMIIGIILVLVVLGFAATQMFGKSEEAASTEPEASVNVDPTSVVATVNGVEITRDELDKKIDEVSAAFPPGAVTPEGDAAFELQVLDEVINLRLLVAEAKKQGFTASEEDIDAELASLVEVLGGQEVFDAQLTQNEITIETLRENMRNELMIRQLFDANTTLEDVVVTDEEVQDMYDQAVAMTPEGSEIPPYEEVAEMARARLIQDKSGEIVSAYIDTLREQSTVQITL